MRQSIYREKEGQDAFTDLLFNALLGFAFMFVAAFALMRDPEMTGKVDPKAEVLITVRWEDRHPDDVDTLVEDRDDRGLFADRIVIDGREVSNPINQETVTVRALQPGEYVVNLLHYQANYSDPLPVTVKVEKLNPSVSLVYYGTRELTGVGDEQTAVRFTIDADGNVAGTSELPKALLTRAAKTGP
jgi:hypothetical protein